MWISNRMEQPLFVSLIVINVLSGLINLWNLIKLKKYGDLTKNVFFIFTLDIVQTVVANVIAIGFMVLVMKQRREYCGAFLLAFGLPVAVGFVLSAMISFVRLWKMLDHKIEEWTLKAITVMAFISTVFYYLFVFHVTDQMSHFKVTSLCINGRILSNQRPIDQLLVSWPILLGGMLYIIFNCRVYWICRCHDLPFNPDPADQLKTRKIRTGTINRQRFTSVPLRASQFSGIMFVPFILMMICTRAAPYHVSFLLNMATLGITNIIRTTVTMKFTFKTSQMSKIDRQRRIRELAKEELEARRQVTDSKARY